MAKRKNLTATLCYAQWAAKNIYEIKDKFVETCKGLGIKFNLVDVDTEDGAKYSVEHNFNNVPIIIVEENGKEISRHKGNQCFISLFKYA